MTQMVVGYKLVDNAGTVYKEWGGIWGQCPGVPNPIFLPNGEQVHAPKVTEDYSGYMLIEWVMDEPVTVTPH